jgi:hypothetical protein
VQKERNGGRTRNKLWKKERKIYKERDKEKEEKKVKT